MRSKIAKTNRLNTRRPQESARRAILLLLILLFIYFGISSLVFAGGESSGGGNGIGKGFSIFGKPFLFKKIYVLDLMEKGIQNDPKIRRSWLIRESSSDKKQISKTCNSLELTETDLPCLLLRSKIAEVRAWLPAYADALIAEMRALRFVLTERKLTDLHDQGTIAISPEDLKNKFQIALRTGRLVEISKNAWQSKFDGFNALDDSNKVALITHEITYSILAKRGAKTSTGARAANALLYEQPKINTPGTHIEESFELITGHTERISQISLTISDIREIVKYEIIEKGFPFNHNPNNTYSEDKSLCEMIGCPRGRNFGGLISFQIVLEGMSQEFSERGWTFEYSQQNPESTFHKSLEDLRPLDLVDFIKDNINGPSLD